MRLDLDQLQALASAVSEGTLEGAARRLHVTPSAISQRIKALETTVGRVLLTRSKPVRPTVSGETLLRAARQIDAIAGEVARELGEAPSAPAQQVPLAANADSLATWLIPALAAVGEPIVFEISRGDETRTAELLRAGTVMAAVTSASDPVPGCIAVALGTMRYRPRASPAFAARWFADGGTVRELAAAPMVCFDREDQTQDIYLRRRARRRLDPPRHYVPGSTAFSLAVRHGLGWGMVPDLQVGPDDDGLVEFDPGRSVDVRLYWQQWRLRTATLELVAEAVRAQAAVALG